MSDPYEHHCPRTDDGFFRITYKATPFAGWHLFARTKDYHLAHYPITITHCPFCGLLLETPEPAITVEATLKEWRALFVFLTRLTAQCASLGLSDKARDPRLRSWIDRLEFALHDPQDAPAKDER